MITPERKSPLQKNERYKFPIDLFRKYNNNTNAPNIKCKVIIARRLLGAIFFADSVRIKQPTILTIKNMIALKISTGVI